MGVFWVLLPRTPSCRTQHSTCTVQLGPRGRAAAPSTFSPLPLKGSRCLGQGCGHGGALVCGESTPSGCRPPEKTGFRGWTLLTHMVSVAGLGRNGVTDHLHHGEVEPEAPEKQLPLRNGSDMVQLHRTGLLPAQLLNGVWLQEGRGRARCGLCGRAGGRSSTPTCVTRGHSTGPRPPGSALPAL